MIELTEHPTIYKPSESEILDYEKEFGQEATVSLLMEREQLIRLEKDDPYHHRQILPHWDDAKELIDKHDQLLISGGNRSGKRLSPVGMWFSF